MCDFILSAECNCRNDFLMSLFALFSGEFAVFFGVAVIAWLISPYGIPRLAMLVVETFNM